MKALEHRLEALERGLKQSRRANRLLVLGIVAMVCLAGAQGTSPVASNDATPSQSRSREEGYAHTPRERTRLRIIEADQFVLLDELGRPRARMVATDAGPALTMLDEEGHKRLELSQTSAASGLRLLDSGESPIVSLQLPSHADPAHLEITGAQGKTVVEADGLSVQDADGHSRLHFALVNGNFPTLGISQAGQTGPPSVELTAAEGARSLKLHNDDGYPTMTLYAVDDGQTSLTLRHPAHERSLEISTGPGDSDGPAVRLFAPANANGTGGLLPHLQIGLSDDHRPYLRIVDGDGRPLFTAPSQ